MFSRTRAIHRILRSTVLLVCVSALGATLTSAQAHPATPARPPMPMVSEKDISATQEQLIKLLRESPTLTTVVAHDPSLLSNQDYVRRNNPQLAQFLDSHPEIALNPDYYLFTRLPDSDGQPYQALERAIWPELTPLPRERPFTEILFNDLTPFLAFVVACGALLWLVRLFVENRRWGRIFKLQTEVHGRLIDKFASNAELLTYMDTEAGKRFLEAAPIPVSFEEHQRVPSAVARVLTPLQIGIVFTLLGAGFLFLRHARADMEIPMLVLGTLVLMPGLGFIISAGITWMLADRLGLMPEAGAASRRLDTSSESQFSSRDRQ